MEEGRIGKVGCGGGDGGRVEDVAECYTQTMTRADVGGWSVPLST
jgi:hypothetical protein